MKKELLIGCGSKWNKRLTCDGNDEWSNLTTLYYNADHKPDMVWNLMWNDVLPPTWKNEFDEIHAYEVLEHLGQQGDGVGVRVANFSWREWRIHGDELVASRKNCQPWVLLWGDDPRSIAANRAWSDCCIVRPQTRPS